MRNMYANNFIISPVLVCLMIFHGADSAGSNHNYNRLVLIESWTRSACCVVNSSQPNNLDCSGCHASQNISRWIIHGFWPSNTALLYTPVFCYDKEQYIHFRNYPGPLLSLLNYNWPSTVVNKKIETVWLDEWKKYGTCATDVKGMETSQGYFKIANDLFEWYNANRILTAADIHHEKEHLAGDIIQAIHSYVGKRPGIACNNRGGLSYLYGIHFCFNKRLEFENCTHKNNCNKTVYYP